MDAETKELFLNGIKNGMGLTKSCEMCAITPKEVSELIHISPTFKSEAIESSKAAYKVMLALSAQYINDYNSTKKARNLSLWLENNETLSNFVSTLNLWQCFCKKKDLTPDKIVKASIIYKTLPETATAIGLTKEEFVDMVYADKKLYHYFADKLFITGPQS